MEILYGAGRLVIWWILLLSFITVLITILIKLHKNVSDGMEPSDFLKRIKWNLVSLLFLGVAGYYVTNIGTAYGPKTEIKAPVKASSRFEDPAKYNEITNKPSWEEIQKKNREENEKARQEFDKLPNATNK